MNNNPINNNASPVLAFIGGGNMASSIIGGLLDSGWAAPNIRVSDPVESQRISLAEQFSVPCFSDNLNCIDTANVVILSVKPQVLHKVVAPIAAVLKQSCPLIISVVAGISSADILRWLGSDLPFVRVMPNTPALVNQGVSGLFANQFTTPTQKELAESIMQAVGKTVWVNDEYLIDAVTGVSGSGPAYFFKLMELMIAEGVASGLSNETAESLVIQTALGAATLAQKSPHSPAKLRQQVTSPGGTTEAGVNFMEQAGIDSTIRGGVQAAVVRSAQLSEQFGGI